MSQRLVVRLIALAVVMVVFGMILRMGILLPFLRENLASLSVTQQMSIAEYVAHDIDDRIRSRRDLIASLAGYFPLALIHDHNRLEAWLKEHHETYSKFSKGLVLIPPNGHGVIAEYPSVPSRQELDFSGSDWFIGALREKGAVIGKPARGRAEGAPLIIMAAPVLDQQGNVAAVLAGVSELSAPDLLAQIQTKRIGKTGGFLLISPKDNLFVSATNPDMILKPLPKPGVNLLHDRAMAGYRGTGITVNAFGVEELSAMVTVPITDWFLVARVPTQEALEALDVAFFFLVRSGVFVGVGILVFLLVLLPRMFRPLTTTSRLIHRMAEGEIELQPVPIVRQDEVGDLAQGFNYLLSRLNEMTDQKLAEQRLRFTEREQMENSLRQWMADTSHELRTPISVMRAQIEAIQDGIHSADPQTLSVLHREVMGLTQLVDDLYTLARSDVGRLDSQNVPLEPLELLDDTISAFRSSYAEAGLAIEMAKRPQESPVVLGDPARLRQVFSNLLENALRYTDRGGKLHIECAVFAGRFVVYFDDTAPGVPDQALNRLFERFFRVDASRSREHGGSGIGLAVSVSLVEAMGGSMRAAHSDLGGLRITLSLPCNTRGKA